MKYIWTFLEQSWLLLENYKNFYFFGFLWTKTFWAFLPLTDLTCFFHPMPSKGNCLKSRNRKSVLRICLVYMGAVIPNNAKKWPTRKFRLQKEMVRQRIRELRRVRLKVLPKLKLRPKNNRNFRDLEQTAQKIYPMRASQISWSVWYAFRSPFIPRNVPIVPR